MTAEVARATIELEHRGNPRLARKLFTRALRSQPEGALDIEVRQGLALALHDLGETAAEAQALRALVVGLLYAHRGPSRSTVKMKRPAYVTGRVMPQKLRL